MRETSIIIAEFIESAKDPKPYNPLIQLSAFTDGSDIFGEITQINKDQFNITVISSKEIVLNYKTNLTFEGAVKYYCSMHHPRLTWKFSRAKTIPYAKSRMKDLEIMRLTASSINDRYR